MPPLSKRPALPAWVRILLWLGLALGLVGLVCAVTPLLLLLWLMGSGPQHDTRALVAPETLALVEVRPDLADPGTAAFLDQLAAAYPDLMVRLRRAQGYPEALARLEALRDVGSVRAGLPGIVPTEVVVVLAPASAGEGTRTLVALNLPSWGRALGLAMDGAAWMQRRLAASDPEIAAFLDLDVAGRRLYGQRNAHGDSVWGSVDGTLVIGSGPLADLQADVLRLAADAAPAPGTEIAAARAALGEAGWEAVAALVYDPRAVDAVWPPLPPPEPTPEDLARMQAALAAPEGTVVEVPPTTPAAPPPRTCLADLDPAAVGALAGGLDVVGPDELAVVVVAVLRDPTGAGAVEACLDRLCAERAPSLAEQGMELACSRETSPGAITGRARITGIGRALDRWASDLEAEVARERDHHAAGSDPLALPDLPEDGL